MDMHLWKWLFYSLIKLMSRVIFVRNRNYCPQNPLSKKAVNTKLERCEVRHKTCNRNFFSTFGDFVYCCKLSATFTQWMYLSIGSQHEAATSLSHKEHRLFVTCIWKKRPLETGDWRQLDLCQCCLSGKLEPKANRYFLPEFYIQITSTCFASFNDWFASLRGSK